MAKMVHDIDWVIKYYSSFFLKFGINEKHLRDHYEEWKLNKIDRVHDYLWYLFNRLLLEVAKQVESEADLYKYQRKIYLEMMVFERKHENKNGNLSHRLFLDCMIREEILNSKYKRSIIIISSHCCSYCDSWNDKKITFEVALRELPITNGKCTRETGCNCTIGFKGERDENDRLIKYDYSYLHKLF